MRFLEKIEFNPELYSFFNKAKVKQVVVNNKEKRWTIHIDLEEMIPVNVYEELLKGRKNIKEVDKILYVLNVKNISMLEEYFVYFLTKIKDDCPTLNSILDNEITYEKNNITVEVINKMELDKFNTIIKKLESRLKDLGFKNIKITTKLNEQKREEVKELIKKTDVKMIKNETEDKIILGNPIKRKSMLVKDIIAEENNVILEVYVFDMEFRETKNGGNIITLKISDNTDSIIAKMFTKESDVVKKLKSSIKKNNWYKIRGFVKHDDYLRELVLNMRDIESIKSKRVVRVDNAEEKRVELHLHTKMSQMDGLIDFDKSLFAKIKELGHRAIGVTDKNTVQEFPKLYNNKGDIKVLF